MSNIYVLVNPYIQGELKNSISSDNSINAAKNVYSKISEYFNNAVPEFYFTLQKGESGKGKYYHFQVIESRVDDNVTFTLEPYDIMGGADVNTFASNLDTFKNKFKQIGGKTSKHSSKKKSESSSSSSSDSDSDSSIPIRRHKHKRINNYITTYDQPIYYWWYDPSLYKLNTYYIPTFYQYITPVIQFNYGY